MSMSSTSLSPNVEKVIFFDIWPSSLRDLRQAIALVPNRAVLINTIPILEAQASSEIENIVTTTDALFRMR